MATTHRERRGRPPTPPLAARPVGLLGRHEDGSARRQRARILVVVASVGQYQGMLFKGVQSTRPYPEHGLTRRDWAEIPPQRIRISKLVTTKKELDLTRVLEDDSTYFGDLFAHVVEWKGEMYLEDGLHRALRAALSSGGDALIHARLHRMPADVGEPPGPGGAPNPK